MNITYIHYFHLQIMLEFSNVILLRHLHQHTILQCLMCTMFKFKHEYSQINFQWTSYGFHWDVCFVDLTFLCSNQNSRNNNFVLCAHLKNSYCNPKFII